MILSGREILKYFVLLFLLLKVLYSDNQILFYSQSPELAQENFDLLTSRITSIHQVIPLIGLYDLIDIRTNSPIGKVSIPSLFHQKYPVIFRKTFTGIDQDKSRYLLHFERINGIVTISINSTKIHTGSNNFLPLTVAVPPRLLNSDGNILEVQIRPWDGKFPHLPPWFPINLPLIGNGICGSVYLEIIPGPFIGEMEIYHHFFRDSSLLTGSIDLHSLQPTAIPYDLRIQLLKDQEVLQEEHIHVSADSMNINPIIPFKIIRQRLEAWKPENVHTYVINTMLYKGKKLIDQKYRKMAVRSITFKNNVLVIDEKPLRLKGLNYIYQYSSGVDLIDRRQVLKDLQMIKEHGFNAIRLCFYPLAPIFYNLTDSLGILCLQDLPYILLNEDVLSDSLAHLTFLKYFDSFLEMAGEHPSVAGIGVGNIYKDMQDEGRKFFRELNTLNADKNSILLYAATFNPAIVNDAKLDFYILELLERNYQSAFLSSLEKKIPWSLPVYIGGSSKAISYRADSDSITHDLKQMTELYWRIAQNPWRDKSAGHFILTYTDYILEMPSLQAGPDDNFRLNTLGIYDMERNLKKEVEKNIKSDWRVMGGSDSDVEKKQIGNYIFIIFGLINFFVFLIIYRSFIEFRKNIFRAIRRPHGFFTDLQERRLVSYEQSFYLMTILAINAAVMIGGIFYFFRNNLFFDYILSIFLPTASLKFFACQIIWRPIILIPFLVVAVMLIFVLFAVPIKLVSVLRKPKIRVRQAIATSTWAGAPFLLLLPFGMFFYNLLVVMNSYWILLSILLYFHLWYSIRWLNGTRVMALLSSARVFLYAMIMFVILFGSIFYYLQDKIDLLTHIDFLIHLGFFHI